MKLVRHNYVVDLKEVLASRTKIFIVLELITGGELFDKIVAEVCILYMLYIFFYSPSGELHVYYNDQPTDCCLGEY